jgi:hypothetical protein
MTSPQRAKSPVFVFSETKKVKIKIKKVTKPKKEYVPLCKCKICDKCMIKQGWFKCIFSNGDYQWIRRCFIKT